jgi:hypothetical protein
MTMTPYDTDLTRCLKWMQNNAPNIQAIINQKATWYQKYNATFWTNWQDNVYDIQTANAFGLVVWCIILGLPLDIFVFDPITNAFAYGDQRGNFLDGGGNVAPITFVSGPVIYNSGVVVPTAGWNLNETSDAVTFNSGYIPAEGAVLTWAGTVKQQNTGQTMIIQEPRQFGTGTGSQSSFSLIPSDSANYNETGNNFYGGGSTIVGLLDEIRYCCQLRYVALVSNGRQQWINQMLQYIFNDGEAWNFPGGEYFYLTDATQAAQAVTGQQVFSADWEGNTLLYTTSRENYLPVSTGIASASTWTKTAVTATAETGPDGTAAGAVLVAGESGSSALVSPSINLALNTVYTASVFLEKGTAAHSTVEFGPASVTIAWGSTPTISASSGVTGTPTIEATGASGWYRLVFTINSGATIANAMTLVPDASYSTGTVYFAYPQVELGASAGQYIRTSSVAVTLTDYTINTSTGAVVTAVAPANDAVLTWTGTWQWATTSGPQQFGTGNGSNVDFTLTAPPGAIPPCTQANYMEYRIGPNMNLSSQFVDLLNTPAYGIMPVCAGIAYAVVQEA